MLDACDTSLLMRAYSLSTHALSTRGRLDGLELEVGVTRQEGLDPCVTLSQQRGADLGYNTYGEA